MKRAVPVVLFASLVAIFGFRAQAVDAYSQYSQNKDATNCRACHGDFRSSPYTSLADGQSWGNSLHEVHRFTMLGGDCDTCHGSGFFPVSLNTSAGGSGLAAISCVGCHGRSEDAGNDNVSGGLGAGLRRHHWTAGVITCGGCHSDANPANYTPVGENVLPPYYANPGSGHANMPTDPCNLDGNEDFAASLLGLDNDGDDDYDGSDSDCAAAAPQIDVAPASHDYGDVPIPGPSSQTFTLSNGGSADLVVSGMNLTDTTNFSLDPAGGPNGCGSATPTIVAGDNCTVAVAFTPVSATAFNATFSVSSNDGTHPTVDVSLTGNGVAGPTPNIAVAPLTVDFGEVNVGSTPAAEVTLSNTGSADLVVSDIALDDTAVYSLDLNGGANPCGSATPMIVAGDNCTVDVLFAPAADGGPFQATVTIGSNDPDTPTASVPVSGSGLLDGDGDGVRDSVDDFPADASKATPPAATGSGKILVDAGANALSAVAAVADNAVIQTGKPSGVTFPDGLVTFQVTVAGAGDNAVVEITFPSTVPSGAKYYKVDADGFSEFAGAVFAGNTVTLSLTDGGSGDTDNTADSVITDPGGFSAPVPAPSSGGGGGGCSVGSSGGHGAGVPALFALAVMAALVAFRRRRQRAGL